MVGVILRMLAVPPSHFALRRGRLSPSPRAARQPRWPAVGREREAGSPEPRAPSPESRPSAQAYAAPIISFRMRMYGDPWVMLLVWVGCPLASPPVPNIRHDSLPEIASRLPQKSVVIAL